MRNKQLLTTYKVFRDELTYKPARGTFLWSGTPVSNAFGTCLAHAPWRSLCVPSSPSAAPSAAWPPDENNITSVNVSSVRPGRKSSRATRRLRLWLRIPTPRSRSLRRRHRNPAWRQCRWRREPGHPGQNQMTREAKGSSRGRPLGRPGLVLRLKCPGNIFFFLVWSGIGFKLDVIVCLFDGWNLELCVSQNSMKTAEGDSWLLPNRRYDTQIKESCHDKI